MSDLRELAFWYRDSGVDYSLGDVAHDYFALSDSQRKSAERPRSASPTTSKPPPPKKPTAPPAVVPDEQAVRRALELASSASDLSQLRSAIESFDGCNLKFTATRTVFADGSPTSDLMVIGEAPGREEDEQGLPFVGRSGQLLDKMLSAIGRDRTNTYITNVIAWRPPGNRTPTPMETEICRPFIERHISLISPKVILLMGGASTKTMLRTSTGILKLRGQWHDIDVLGESYRVLPTLHPAYLLRQPLQKRLSWTDFLLVRSALE